MYKITTRPPSPDEQQLIARRMKSGIGSWGCLIVLFGIGPAYLLGTLGRWLGGFISKTGSTYGQWIGVALGAVVFVVMASILVPYQRRFSRRLAQDAEEGIVQDIHVVEPRVIQIALINDHEPILALDIGDNKILLLQGQWLQYADTYGATHSDEDPPEEFLNCLPAPHSFPSSEFTVSRLPHSGEVLGIRVQGTYRAPEAEVEALKREYDFGDSEIFDGPLDDVAGVLAREHERRSIK